MKNTKQTNKDLLLNELAKLQSEVDKLTKGTIMEPVNETTNNKELTQTQLDNLANARAIKANKDLSNRLLKDFTNIKTLVTNTWN